MNRRLFASTIAVCAMALAEQAHAGTLNIYAINDADGITGNLTITYGSTPDAKYSNAFEITGISGEISDPTLGITNESVRGLVDLNKIPGDPLAPADFSANATSGFTYDNLVWPDGSAIVCTGFNSSGTLLDVYGVHFTLDNGAYVDLWGNGLTGAADPGFGFIPGGYGIAVNNLVDPTHYVAGAATLTVPEPGTWTMLGLGFLGLGIAVARRPRRAGESAAA